MKEKEKKTNKKEEGKSKSIIMKSKGRRSTKEEHYVDTNEFDARIVEFYKSGASNRENFEKIGEIFSKMANRLFSSMSFNDYYVWDEKMVGAAIVKMVKALNKKNFDVNKIQEGKHAFSYFTTIIKNEFVAVIEKERRRAETERHICQMKYVESFRDCEETRNIYIKPEYDGEIF